ncbi:MAG: hypothetical protein C4292_02495 [Nitrososphaera sp.]
MQVFQSAKICSFRAMQKKWCDGSCQKRLAMLPRMLQTARLAAATAYIRILTVISKLEFRNIAIFWPVVNQTFN